MARNFTLLFLLFMTFSAVGRSQDRFEKNDMGNVKYVKFYPNPATTFIIIELQKTLDKSCSFQIFNFSGKKIVEMQVIGRARIDLTSFSRGIYIIQLKDRNGKTIEAGKFQIEK